MTVKPDAVWKHSGATAWVFPHSSGVQRPVVLVADGGPVDMEALVGKLDDPEFALREQLAVRGRDLIVVGFDHDPTDLAKAGSGVLEVVFRSIGERTGQQPLTVGGIGRGALAARYALAKMECDRMDHQTNLYFSYNGAGPATTQESAQLEKVGGRPMRPFLLKVTAGVADVEGLSEDATPDETIFDDVLFVAEPSATGIVTAEAAKWLLDRLR
ncbi:hypothetical protein ACFC06_00695 [Nocardia sp. NPDC056064]|uniref:hypothetical protein n=1 Tax=Nocardia sp. NPDC056064 TaxID=3345701 RepID=UPI0035D9A83F